MCLRSKLCKNFQSAAKKIFFWPFWVWGEKFADDQQTRLKIFLDRSKTKVGTFKNSFIIKNRSEKLNYAFLSRLWSTELLNCPNDWDWKVQLKTVCWRVQLKVFPEKKSVSYKMSVWWSFRVTRVIKPKKPRQLGDFFIISRFDNLMDIFWGAKRKNTLAFPL